MEKYCWIVCNENKRIVEFIRATTLEDATRHSGKPNWRYVGKVDGVYLIAYAPFSAIGFVNALRNTRLIKNQGLHYDFSISKVNLKTATPITFEELINFYCKYCDDLYGSTINDFKETCAYIHLDLILNEQIKADSSRNLVN